jgi:phosphopantetheinyl transferase
MIGSIRVVTKGDLVIDIVTSARDALDIGKTVIVLIKQNACLDGLEPAHPDEIARAGRFQFERDAFAHLAGRCLARSLLRFLATNGVFETGARGKPFCPGHHPFSIAHSGAWIGVAVCPMGEIGLDIEARAEGFQADDIASVICSQSELDWIGNEPSSQEGFLKVWTRKEALLKRKGVGLTDNLPSVDTAPHLANGASILAGRLWSERLNDGALLAVATETQCKSLWVLEAAGARCLEIDDELRADG